MTKTIYSKIAGDKEKFNFDILNNKDSSEFKKLSLYTQNAISGLYTMFSNGAKIKGLQIDNFYSVYSIFAIVNSNPVGYFHCGDFKNKDEAIQAKEIISEILNLFK